MRPYDIDYDEFDEFDDFGYSKARAVRHTVNRRHRDEPRPSGHRRGGRSAKDRWYDDEWADYESYGIDGYDSYDIDEIETLSRLSFDHH